MTEPMSAIPVIHFNPESLILFGDPKQLPPTITTKCIQGNEDDGLDQTLFTRLSNLNHSVTHLRTQYRVIDQFCTLINQT